jgi:hypothetical protein
MYYITSIDSEKREYIMMLENCAMIKNDVIEAFNKAVANEENQFLGGGLNWNFVDADLNIGLGMLYTSEYLYECFGVLVDNYFEVLPN